MELASCHSFGAWNFKMAVIIFFLGGELWVLH